MNSQLDALFERKTKEASAIILSRQQEDLPQEFSAIPFEVNKVIGQIAQEDARRKKVLKRKPT